MRRPAPPFGMDASGRTIASLAGASRIGRSYFRMKASRAALSACLGSGFGLTYPNPGRCMSFIAPPRVHSTPNLRGRPRAVSGPGWRIRRTGPTPLPSAGMEPVPGTPFPYRSARFPGWMDRSADHASPQGRIRESEYSANCT